MRFCFILFLIFINILPCQAGIVEEAAKEEAHQVFIYHIPDDDEIVSEQPDVKDNLPDIVSDDVTADTSRKSDQDFESDEEQDFIEKITIDENGYEIEDMYSDVLKGYAVYEQGEEDAVSLEDSTDSFLTLKLQQPYNYKGGKYYAPTKSSPFSYSKFSNMEYSITPISSTHAKKFGGFTTGTMFNQLIDTAELEQSTGVYSRYDSKYWGVYTAYSKTLNSTNSNYSDNFYFSPELKLNQYFTLKEILSADITRNRKKAEFVVSINPFGKKDYDRLRIEFGANATFDDDNEVLKNQFKFSTKFKL